MEPEVGEEISVLHVDDDKDFGDLTKAFLERQSERFAVETVTSAGVGLERLEEGAFDCVVSDHDMPGRNGVEFLDAVRDRYPDLPFVLFTGKGSEEVASEAISAGVSDYLQKDVGNEKYELLANRIETHVERTRVRRDLEEREAHLANAQEMANLGSWEADVVDDRLEWSDEGSAIYGVSAEAMGYESFLESVHPADRDRVDGAWRAALEGAEYDIEHRIVTEEGETRWVRSRADVEFADGTPVRARGVVQDITGRKEREERLREERDRRNALFRNPSDAIVEIAFDGDTPVIQGTNGTFEAVFGFESAAVVGEPVAEVLVPDEAATRDRHEEIKRTILDGEAVETEVRRRTADGQREFLLRVFPIEFADGHLGSYAIYTDITERTERERELQLYREAVEASGHSIYFTGEDGTIEYVNPAFEEKTGYAAEEAIGRNPNILKSGEHDEAYYERLWGTITSGEVWRDEVINETKDGEEYVVDQTIAPVVGESGAIDHFVAVNVDISERRERERELQRSRERLRVLFDRAPDAIVIHDADGEVLEVNAENVENLGYTRDELLSMNVADFDVHSRAELRELWADMEVGRTVKVESEHERADGSTFPTEIWVSKIEVQGEERFLALGRDSTERKERERDLEEYRTLVEAVGDAMYVLDTDGYVRMANQAMVEHLEADADDVVGSRISEFTTEADFERSTALLEELLADPDRRRGSLEMTAVTTTGREIPVETHVAVLTDDAGDYRGSVGVVRDVTERKERERELERYETMANTAGDMVYILDRRGRFQFVNDATERLTGHASEAIVGEHVSLILGDDDIAEGREIIRRLLAAEDGVTSEAYEIDLQRADGSTVTCESHITLLQQDGEWAGTVGVVRDITERKKREEQLERFTDIVSHDLRNPLNVADGRLEIARDDCENEHLEKVGGALDRMETLIADLLRLAKVGEEVEAEPVDLTTLVERCWDHVPTADASLVTETDRAIRADRSRCQQLLENLVRNAIDHGGAAVTVTVGELDDGDGFFVADDGPGVPPDEREAVFGSGHTQREDGTGLGLAIVREIAEAHDWTVTLTESETGGARFEFDGVEYVR